MEMGSQEGSQETSSPERAMGRTAAEAQGLSFAAIDTLGQGKGFLRSVGTMWSEELCAEQELNRWMCTNNWTWRASNTYWGEVEKQGKISKLRQYLKPLRKATIRKQCGKNLGGTFHLGGGSFLLQNILKITWHHIWIEVQCSTQNSVVSNGEFFLQYDLWPSYLHYLENKSIFCWS